MQRLFFALTLLFTLLGSTVGHAQSVIPYSELQNFNYGGPLPLKQLINDLEGNIFPSAKKHAFSHVDWEVGVKMRNGWKVGAFVRHDYYTRFNPDTVRLIHQDKNDLPVDTNQHYDLWLAVHHLKADGIRIHLPKLEYESFQIGLSVSVFHGTGLIDGEVSGQIDTTSNSFSGLVDLDYRYDRDRLLNREANSPEGWGFGFDFEVQWQISPSIELDLRVKDIAGQVRWDQAPFTTAQLTSSTVNFDQNGFIETTPALSGFEGYRSYTQDLPIQSKLTLSYRLSEQYGVFGIDEV